MAKISTPALTPKMYRHFAVVTVVFTLLLAIFSSGENRQAIADQVAKQQAAAKARRDATRAKYGTPKMVRAPAASADFKRFDDYGDVAGDYGAPMDQGGSTVQDVGSLSVDASECAKGFLVQVAKSDEDPDGPPVQKCLRRKGEAGSEKRPLTPAERKQEIDALLKSTLHNTPGAGAGN